MRSNENYYLVGDTYDFCINPVSKLKNLVEEIDERKSQRIYSIESGSYSIELIRENRIIENPNIRFLFDDSSTLMFVVIGITTIMIILCNPDGIMHIEEHNISAVTESHINSNGIVDPKGLALKIVTYLSKHSKLDIDLNNRDMKVILCGELVILDKTFSKYFDLAVNTIIIDDISQIETIWDRYGLILLSLITFDLQHIEVKDYEVWKTIKLKDLDIENVSVQSEKDGVALDLVGYDHLYENVTNYNIGDSVFVRDTSIDLFVCASSYKGIEFKGIHNDLQIESRKRRINIENQTISQNAKFDI